MTNNVARKKNMNQIEDKKNCEINIKFLKSIT